MPRRCGLGCTPTRGVLHVFPNPDKFPEQFKAWVRVACGQGECNFNYRNMRICDRHFTEKDRNRYNRLNALAVPSLFLHEQPSNTCGLSKSTSEQTFNQPEVSDNYHQSSSGKIDEKAMEKSSLDIPEVSDIQQSTSDSNKKRKYVPETTDFDDDRTQCPDDNDIFVSEMCSQPLDYQHEDKTKFKDSSTCTENNMLSTPSVIDVHGSNYFSQLVSNELLRFDIKKRYKIMQKILEVLHNEK